MENSKKLTKAFFDAVGKSKKKDKEIRNLTSIRKQMNYQFHWIKHRSKFVQFLKDE